MLKKLSNFILPWWFKYAVIAILAGMLVVTNLRLDAARAQRDAEIDFRQTVAKNIGCSKSGRSAVASCVSILLQTNQSRGVALDQISAEALASKQRADRADAELVKRQAEHQRQYAAAQRRIDQLAGRKPTGNAEQDLAIIEEDSEAAWKGWR